MEFIRLEAYAKVNLGLDVVKRLENGYHEVRMVMQTVGIHDTLRLEKTKEGIALFTDSSEMPDDENNLAYKAAHVMKERYGIADGVVIHLQKRIPVAAGMAGGSTDAAAVLKGMNILFSLGLSRQELCDVGVRLGADVPY
ncbi:MAG: 4-(cytidine 5'-diphospho)-2-C-methyl-D-erythritol kinase, partial [Lachnospiraceae bacterium]|nr:4-(cytidine 5'-diphospho)-2-C-methyl-D-erythritol kinase [Lachnospiraceae bacterium]